MNTAQTFDFNTGTLCPIKGAGNLPRGSKLYYLKRSCSANEAVVIDPEFTNACGQKAIFESGAYTYSSRDAVEFAGGWNYCLDENDEPIILNEEEIAAFIVKAEARKSEKESIAQYEEKLIQQMFSKLSENEWIEDKLHQAYKYNQECLHDAEALKSEPATTLYRIKLDLIRRKENEFINEFYGTDDYIDKQSASELKAQEKEQHLVNYGHLMTCLEDSKGFKSDVAESNLKKILKLTFPSVNFRVETHFEEIDVSSVKFVESVNVIWENGPKVSCDVINKIDSLFTTGAYNAHEDYNYAIENEFAEIFGGFYSVYFQRNITGDKYLETAKELGIEGVTVTECNNIEGCSYEESTRILEVTRDKQFVEAVGLPS